MFKRMITTQKLALGIFSITATSNLDDNELSICIQGVYHIHLINYAFNINILIKFDIL